MDHPPAAEAAPRLLIVEDDPMQLQITLEMARRFAQFSAIATAFGVSEALLIVKSGKIDIVLCDLNLAGQTCDEIVGAVRSLSLPRQPVIAMFTNEAVRGVESRVGVPLFRKPIGLLEMDSLFASVLEHWRRKRDES